MADGGGGDGNGKYSCKTASETLEWIHAIIEFLKPYRFFLDAHVVNFFKDRLWETVDAEWMHCLRKEPVENLLLIPSGVVQDHWPASLKEYVLTIKTLSLPRDQADLQEMKMTLSHTCFNNLILLRRHLVPSWCEEHKDLVDVSRDILTAFPGLRVAPLNNVIAQGMNQKKKHEIEALAAVIASIARRAGAATIMDVGSGQGYLAQVLSFEHGLSVIAIDASSHHGSITEARAKRIEKYYAAKTCKSRLENKDFSIPRTVTCRVLSAAMLKDVGSCLLQGKDLVKPTFIEKNAYGEPLEEIIGSELPPPSKEHGNSSFILAGLHACGDLSVTMLRTFVECDEVKAVVSIGCCYNLLSEEGAKEANSRCGFPVSKGATSASLLLGKNARDLACQSAERWRGLGEAAGLHNFELHAFRAAFQMVLSHYHPEIMMRNPSIGRQGKALRRQHHRRILESNANIAESLSQKNCSAPGTYPEPPNEEANSVDRYSMFVKFCRSGLGRLGVHDAEDIEFYRVWNEAQEFSELVGPYWTLRTALGPVLETLLLLDRLLFLQEQGSQATMVPLFDPVLSPRNVALIAEKF